jgi:hypothetical protein
LCVVSQGSDQTKTRLKSNNYGWENITHETTAKLLLARIDAYQHQGMFVHVTHTEVPK